MTRDGSSCALRLQRGGRVAALQRLFLTLVRREAESTFYTPRGLGPPTEARR